MSSNQGPSEKADQMAHAVIGAAIEVHRRLGPGFLEQVYEEALCVELQLRQIPFERQRRVPLEYKGVLVGEPRLDLLVGAVLVVELKAVVAPAPVHRRTVISYLAATGLHLGLLINFNVLLLREGIQRIVRS